MARTQLSVETLLAELPAMTVVRPVELIGRTFPAGQARHVLLETYSLTPQTLAVQVVSGPAALSPAGLRTPRSVSAHSSSAAMLARPSCESRVQGQESV